MTLANLIEIFTSFQGEGLYLGQEMTFVRFQNCALSCNYCDTPASFQKLSHFRKELAAHSGEFESFANPVSADQLTEHLPSAPAILSLTGGEPLQHGDFLKEWLPRLQGRYPILLETNGVLPRELEKVLPWTDILSMDFKLASATGMKNYAEEHQRFLQVAAQKKDLSLYVKAVVLPSTPLEEIEQAARIVAGQNSATPFFIQPVTASSEEKITFAPLQFKAFWNSARKYLEDVRVVPQLHPYLQVL